MTDREAQALLRQQERLIAQALRELTEGYWYSALLTLHKVQDIDAQLAFDEEQPPCP